MASTAAQQRDRKFESGFLQRRVLCEPDFVVRRTATPLIRPDEILVVMAIADGGRLHNRCGTEPIR